MIQTLLVANRGEIACRIMRSARRMGMRCIAVYSEADRDAPHTRLADTAFCIGPAPARDSYLDIDKILNAARESGADAIHPGYGFLSENAQFAQRCDEAGIAFVGPPAGAIESMGSKSAAKGLMAEAGVPLVPGYHGEEQDLERLRAEADRIGYPVLIKASAGGGGKGMRVVWSGAEVQEQLAAAQREAQSSFGDPRVLLEKYVLEPRHVEVQILFDQQGHGIYLFDRDCSLQRRHQKIIEEAPAPGLEAELARAMGEAALRCGEATGYVGAGTVEFLLDRDHNFYFMEMNTRLQVEHPVSEMITGIDLVEAQLRVARGEALPWTQADLSIEGHAIEARLYAEDPNRDFLPTSGRIQHLRWPPEAPGLRIDAGVAEGQTITSDYDPMLAKVIAWGSSRDEARRRLAAALADVELAGFATNLPFLSRALNSAAFRDAELATDFLERQQAELERSALEREQQVQLSWLLWFEHHRQLNCSSDPWSRPSGWRLGPRDWQLAEVRIAGEDHSLRYRVLSETRAELELDAPCTLEWQQEDGTLRLSLNGRQQSIAGYFDGAHTWQAFAAGENWQFNINHPEFTAEASDDHALNAPMHGRVIALHCRSGDEVEANQPLVVLEAMKMEHTLRAPARGRIVAVLCEEQENVNADQALIEFEAGESAQ